MHCQHRQWRFLGEEATLIKACYTAVLKGAHNSIQHLSFDSGRFETFADSVLPSFTVDACHQDVDYRTPIRLGRRGDLRHKYPTSASSQAAYVGALRHRIWDW